VAIALNNVGWVLKPLGEPDKALHYFQEALEMTQRLYPKKDHALVALYLNNLGIVHKSLGEARKALPYHEQALEMTQRLHPKKGHPYLGMSLNIMGKALETLGELGKALTCFEQSLTVCRAYLDREMTFAPEAQALALVQSLPHTPAFSWRGAPPRFARRASVCATSAARDGPGASSP
jgi:tetratricopeptide (TPR) repeat protein